MKLLFFVLVSLVSLSSLHSQCATWNDSPRKEEAENAHVIYRQHFKAENFAEALPQWKIAYEIAPAADGRRESHFKDGIEMYKHFYQKETDEAKKADYKKKVLDLYDQWAECVKQKSISYKDCNDQACIDMRQGVVMGRKATDMFYILLPPRMETYKVLKQAVEQSGWETEYTVFRPYAYLLVYLVGAEKIPPEEAREAHQLLNELADYSIENDERLSSYFASEKDAMNQVIESIEGTIYDCEYFKEKYRPEYELDSENIELVGEIIKTLKRQECTPDDPFLAQLEAQYAEFAEEYNAAQQAEFEKRNPAAAANRLYKEGKYAEALVKYKEAVDIEEDKEKLASYYFSMASIQFRKLDQMSAARDNARKAANLRGNWGRPYMLIGDMYAKSSSSCGNDAYTRGLAVLAAIDKWALARSIDSEVASEANRNIAKFSQYMPPKEDVFMQGKSEGEVVSVQCWIGESVKLRYN